MPIVPGARDRRPRRCRARRRRDSRSAIASAFRGSATRAASAGTAGRAREPVSGRAIHRLSDRRRLRRPCGGRRALRVPPAGSYDDADAAPLLVCGPHRLSRVSNGRRRQAPRALRLRRGRAHHRAGRRAPGTRDLRLRDSRRRRRRGASRWNSARRGRAGRTGRRRRRSTPPSSSRPSAGSCRKRSRRTAPGGTVVCAGIHMSDIPSFPYRLLWEERVIRSVANLTRQDAREFLALAGTTPIRTRVQRVSARGRESRTRRSPPRPVERRGGAGSVVLVP